MDQAPSLYTDVMKTQALKQALDAHGFDGAIGGARRDEEASRAKERVFSFRAAGHRWDPRQQRPEMWRLLNGRLGTEKPRASFRSQIGPSAMCGANLAREARCGAPLFCRRAPDH